MSRLTALAKTFGRISQQLILAITIIGLATPLQALAANARISEVMPNPAGISNASAEWIEIQNLTDSSIDLTGWSVRDAASNSAPLVGSIPANGTFVLCLVASAPEGVICDQLSSNVPLNNDGDTIFLNNGIEDIDSLLYAETDAVPGTSLETQADDSIAQNTTVSYDSNGNTGTPNSAPAVVLHQPEHETPDDGSYLNTGNIEFDWSDVDYAYGNVTYEWEVSVSNTTGTDGSFTGRKLTRTGLTNSEHTESLPIEKVYYWHVRAVADNGNTTEWTDAETFTLDDTVPVTTLSSPSDSSRFIGQSIYISGRTTDEGGSVETIVIYARLADSDNPDEFVEVKRIDGPSEGSYWSTYWDPNTEPSDDEVAQFKEQAIFDIKVAGIDAAGNQENSDYAYDVLWDTAAPDLPEHISPADGKFINHMSPTLQWEDVNDSDVRQPVCYVVQISFSSETKEEDNGFTDPTASTDCMESTEVEYPVPDGVDKFYWQVMVCDSGNFFDDRIYELSSIYDEQSEIIYCSDWTDPWSVNIDKTAPKITVDSTSSSNHVRSLSGTIDDADASIKIEVLGKTYTATNNGDGTWSLPPIQFTPCHIHGTYEVKATATDEAGNVGKDNTTDELTIIDIPGCDGSSDIDYVSGAEESGEDVDSDGDGFTDAEEIEAGTNPNDPDDFPGSDEEEKDEGVEGETDESTFEYRWLILIAAVIAFLWFLLRRREEDEEGVV